MQHKKHLRNRHRAAVAQPVAEARAPAEENVNHVDGPPTEEELHDLAELLFAPIEIYEMSPTISQSEYESGVTGDFLGPSWIEPIQDFIGPLFEVNYGTSNGDSTVRLSIKKRPCLSLDPPLK